MVSPSRLIALLLLSSHSSFAEGKEKSAPAAPANYQIQPGVFPPLEQAKLLAGELIAVDHVNRAGVLRDDRTDDQTKAHWDRAHPFTLLPYALVMRHGAPAELRDIPLGTHLHAEFFEGPEVPQFGGAYQGAINDNNRRSKYLNYSRAARLEDDFSRDLRTGRKWRVEGVDAEAGKLTATNLPANASARPAILDIGPDTRVWKGPGFGTLADLKPGATFLANHTLCTLTGPGRCTALWLDDASRAAATARQTEVHRRHQRTHGLAGWIDTVDNQRGVVSVTVFGGMDAALFEEFSAFAYFRAAVAEESLRTWDQINDYKGGAGAAVRTQPAHPCDSGVRVTFTPAQLLEGFRPRRFVRLWPGDGKVIVGWPLGEPPKEERLFGQ